MLSGLSLSAENLPVVRIRRDNLSDALIACSSLLVPKKQKNKKSRYGFKTLVSAASSLLWTQPKTKEDADMPDWFAEISMMSELGDTSSFLTARDIFRLFLILRELNGTDNPAEQSICQTLIPYYDLFFGARSLWDFITALDQAWFFRYPRRSSEDDFFKINPSPSNTPPPEEDTCGEERFIRLMILDEQKLRPLMDIAYLMLQADYKNRWPSDKLGILMDKLTRQDAVWLQTLSECLTEMDPSLFHNPDFWHGCLDAEDPVAFFSPASPDEQKELGPSDDTVPEMTAEHSPSTSASPDDARVAKTLNGSFPFRFILTPPMPVLRQPVAKPIPGLMSMGFYSMMWHKDIRNIYVNSLNYSANVTPADAEDDQKQGFKGPP